MAGEVTRDQDSFEIVSAQKVGEELARMRRILRRMVVVTGLLCLAVFLLAACVFGYLANYFSFEPVLVGGVSVGAALAGFVVGLIVGRR